MSETAELFAALAKAQAEFPGIPKNKRAQIPGRDGKGGFSYAYADLADILDAVRKPLADNGLAVVQGMDGGHLVTRILHKSGAEIHDGGIPVPQNSDPQKLGSALTYMRRYGLCAMLGITADEDVDGQGGEGEAPAPRKAPEKPVQRRQQGNVTRAYNACVDAVWGAMPCTADEFDRWCQSATADEAQDAASSLFQAWTAVNGSPDLKALPERERNEIIAIKDHIKAGIQSVKQAKRAA